MMSLSLRRLLPLIFLNVVVSAVVVIALLLWWDSRNGQAAEAVAIPSPSAVATAAGVVPPAGTPQGVPAEASQEEAAPEDASEGVVHTVQAGDTLGRISEFYEVSMADIVAANSLSNPDVLSVGQQLVIPVGGLPTEAPEPASTEIPVGTVPTPIAAETAEEGGAQVEISNVLGVGTLEEEAIEIVNTGTTQQTMQGWQLADQDGNLYTFGQVTVFGEGAGILLHTRAGDSSATDLYWGLEESAWESGEMVTLTDADNQVVATFAVP
jgi:LysM repeat protein